MIDRDFEQVSEEHMKSMTKPEGPAQESSMKIDDYVHPENDLCAETGCAPATPAPSQPAGAREWKRQEPCPECDGDGCAACLADVDEWFRVNRPKLHDAVKYAAGEKGKAFDIIVFEACAAYATQRTATLTDKLCRMQDDIAAIVSTHRADWSWNDVIADVKGLAQQTAAKDAEWLKAYHILEDRAHFQKDRAEAAERERDSLREQLRTAEEAFDRMAACEDDESEEFVTAWDALGAALKAGKDGHQ